MPARSYIVGKQTDCDICVVADTVSARHCLLTLRGQQWWIEDLGSSNGTYVNGQRLTSSRPIDRDDRVTLGRKVPLPLPETESSILIGRDPDNEIVVPLDIVSSQHARLEVQDGIVWLQDLGSSNGTAINNPANKIDRAVLRPGDIVYLGSHALPATQLLSALPCATSALASVAAQPVPVNELPKRPQRHALNRYRWRDWATGVVASVVILWGASQVKPLLHPAALPTPLAAVQRAKPSTIAPEAEDVVPAPPALPPAEIPARAVSDRVGGSLMLLGLRFDDQILLTEFSGWLCRPDVLVCDVNDFDLLVSKLKTDGELSESLVAVTSQRTLQITKHRRGEAAAAGLVALQLEDTAGTALSVCEVEPRPQQRMGLVGIDAPSDSPQSIRVTTSSLAIDRIARDTQNRPRLLVGHTEAPIQATRPLLIDSHGRVVGVSIRTAAPGQRMEFVPVDRLRSLITSLGE